MRLRLLLIALSLFIPFVRGHSVPPDWHAPGWLAVTNAVRDEVFAVPRKGPLPPRGQIVYVLTATLETMDGSVYLKLADETNPSWMLAFSGNALQSSATGDFVEDFSAFQAGSAVVNARLYPMAIQNKLRVEVETIVNGVKQNTAFQIPLSTADENGMNAITLHLSGTARAGVAFVSRQLGTLLLVR